MKILLTGIAGFIGSTLSEQLLELGYDILGLDCFTSYYSKAQKLDNLKKSVSNKKCTFIEADILDIDLSLIKDIDVIVHLAAQPGVRPSWSEFEVYVRNNVVATKRLLDAAVNLGARKFVFASSSSVYGDAESYPTKEDTVPRPVSPYGITKDTCEKLCRVYHDAYSLHITTLRFFTVYGPRQRPDMGFHKFIERMLANQKITIYGDGNQIRDFTYVGDIVQGVIAALESDSKEETYNLGGGRPTRLLDVINVLKNTIGVDAEIEYAEAQRGDARKTLADIGRARKELNYNPTMKLEQGLSAQVDWHRKRLNRTISN